MPQSPFRLLLISRETTRARTLQAAVRSAELPPGRALAVDVLPVEDLRGDLAATRVGACDLALVSHVLEEDQARAAGALLDDALRPAASVLVLNSLRPLLLRTRLPGLDLAALAVGDGAGLPAALRGVLQEGDATPHLQELIRSLPRLLERLPPGMHGLRALLEAQLYWRDPTPGNLCNLALMLADHCSGRTGAWSGCYEAPRLAPSCALYVPGRGASEESPSVDPERPLVGLLVMRGQVLSGDTRALDGFIRCLEDQDLQVLAAFAESFDFREAVTRWFDPAGVDAIVNLSGFPLVGGHNHHEGDSVRAFLRRRAVPYVTPPQLLTQTVAEWQRSRLGLSPIEGALQLAVHELEGGLEPIPTSGPQAAGSDATRVLLPGRAARLARRLARRIALRRMPNREKRILLTVFAFPPGKGSVGTAAALDVFRSAHAILERLRGEGYSVEVPATPEELLHRVVCGEDPRASIRTAELSVGARLSVAAYERIAPEWKRLRRLWGEPPGELDSDGEQLLISGARLGNVFVGVQPGFGFEGDPMRLLFDPAATPHHGFLAFYRWAEQEFGAHAVIHLGTHGALEFMPGKQTALGDDCWPDLLAGDLPITYLYAVNNPSEATIAKRRGGAATLGHLTPPGSRAGLQHELQELLDTLRAFLSEQPGPRRQSLGETVLELVRASDLEAELAGREPLPSCLDASGAERLSGALQEICAQRIPVGLHVVGRNPQPHERVELLCSAAEHDRPELGVTGLVPLVLAARGLVADDLRARLSAREAAALRTWDGARSTAGEVIRCLVDGGEEQAEAAASREGLPLDDALRTSLRWLAGLDARLAASDELTPLVDSLAGRHVEPGPGGDPVRNADVLPTGRNVHALDPARVPTTAALRNARRTTDLMLARRRAELGRWPRRVGLVLWGLDNIKTQGEGIAQAFHLLGVRPLPNSVGRVDLLEVIPAAELERPRIDVTVSASGIFRDIFGHHLALIDRAVRLVADLDEPAEANFVRKGVQELRAQGLSPDAARTRVFSNQGGTYGAHVDHMVALGRWEERGDLADLYARRKGFAYTAEEHGVEARAVLETLAAGIDTTFQNVDSAEVSISDVDHYFEYLGGLTALAEKASGKRPGVLLADATGAAVRVRSLEEAVRLESRTRLLNPRWYEGLLAHGFEGVEEIRKRLDYTFGWSATADGVPDWVYRRSYETFFEDERQEQRMREANPHALAAMARRLLEADGRGFWAADERQRARLQGLLDGVEDALEGLTSA